MSVGEALAQAREERGLSVEAVSAATRIRAGLIRSIEADDFSGCGGAVYARGHLRNIARAVGIDPEPLVEEYDREHAQELVPQPVHVPMQPTDPELVARAERHAPNWTAAMAAALLVICAIAGYGLVHHSPSHPAADTGPAPTVTTSPTPHPAAPPASAIAQVPNTVAVALIRVTGGKTWLQVETLSGKLLFQGLLSPGQSKVFRDPHGLRMVIGNAPAVQLVADNHDFGTPQSSGNVAHVTVQPGGDVQFA